MQNIIRLVKSRKYKNSHFCYYLKNFLLYLAPNIVFRRRLSFWPNQYRNDTDISNRVNYYNKLEHRFNGSLNGIKIKDFRLSTKLKPHAYFLDAYEYMRYFPKENSFAFIFGDITTIPKIPSLLKSRPILGDNQNSVLLKLNKIRHFLFIKDTKRFEEKKNILLGRAGIHTGSRVKFWEMYFGTPMCDLGQINKNNKTHPEWITERMSIAEHLEYKFILCLEGNDVASNLKWVMSSNSIAVMPKPTYETWFMEGRLIGDYHYIEIKSDYSDLEDRLNYYIEHTDKALDIIENAHRYIAQFQDKKREKIISLLVLQKYFQYTNA